MVAASFIFLLDLVFFFIAHPIFAHMFTPQDLDAFLAVLCGTREADGSPRLVKG